MSTPLLETRALCTHFPITRGARRVFAVNGVDLAIHRGEAVGLVGESGCGKTTLGKTMIRLLEPTSGTISFDGRDIAHASASELSPLRRRMQMIFQDPYAALNPRLTVESALAEALEVHRIVPSGDVSKEIDRLLDLVGLGGDSRKKYPHEFSGGQRQRIVIARALSVRPEFILADEPVSALDVSIRAQILNLLMDLRDQLQLTVLLISHDLSVVEHFCGRVMVMYLGRIVESLPAADLRDRARHPYTRALVAALPVVPDLGCAVTALRSKRVLLGGDPPSALELPQGCAFRARCSRAEASCADATPPLVSISVSHALACPVAARD